MLLKWKPASHNSVDFTLLPSHHNIVSSCASCEQALTEGQEYFLGVYGDNRVQLAFDLDHSKLKKLSPNDSLHYAVTEVPARIQFPGGEDPDELLGLVVECSFDAESHSWCFMRDRTKYAAMQQLSKRFCCCLFLCPVCQHGSGVSWE